MNLNLSTSNFFKELAQDNVQVSVIMPVYNGENCIERSVKSVLSQTDINVELICIDDGSSDNSVNILNNLHNKDNRLIVLKQNHQGAGTARNLGIEHAKGQFIAFMDADDYYPNKKVLSTLYGKACEKKVKVCGGSIIGNLEKENRTLDLDKNILQESLPFSEQKFENGYSFKESRLFYFKDYQFSFGYQRFIFDGQLIKENHICFPDYLRGQDPPFFIEAMLKANEFFALNVPTYVYIIGYKKVNWTKQKIIGYLSSINHCLDIALKNEFSELKKFWVIEFFKFTYNLLNLEQLFDRDIHKLFIKIKNKIIFFSNTQKELYEKISKSNSFEKFNKLLEVHEHSSQVPKKAIIWGIKNEYEQIKNSIYIACRKNLLDIVGYCCRKNDIDSELFNGRKVFNSDNLHKENFDLIIIANFGSFKTIKNIAEEVIKKSQNTKAKILSYRELLTPPSSNIFE